MSNMSEILGKIKANKTFICFSIFIFYALGLFSFYLKETLFIAPFVTVFILILILIASFNKTFSKHFSSIFFLVLYLLFIVGFLNAKINYVNSDELNKIDYLKNVEITGKISSLPKFTSQTANYKFSLKASKLKTDGVEYKINNSVILAVIKDKDNKLQNKLKYYDEYKLIGTLSKPNNALNPSQFDYREFLKRRGILKTFYVNDDSYYFLSSPKISDIKNCSSISNKLELLNIVINRKMHDVRDNVIKKHSKYIKSPNLEVLGGIVFGDDAVNPPDEVKGSFINSGLLHLLAASGLNVALILSIWFCFIYFLNLPYRLKILSGIFIIFLYAIMTGFPPSIIRASVMLVLVLIGKLMYRDTNGVSLIFAAGFLILLFKPEYVLDVGFQLSFLVTLGLIICVPCVSCLLGNKEKDYINKIKNYPNIIKSLLLSVSPVSIACCFVIPFIAQLWAAPLQAYYFNTFSVYSIIANIAVVPFIGIVSFLGFLSTAICSIPYISDIILPVLDFILNFIIQIILNISDFFSSLPNALIKVPSPDIYSIIVFYIFVVLFFASVKYLFKNKILNKTLFCIFVILLVLFIKIPNNNPEVIFFSVGNADNALIKTQHDKYIMIDTGRFIYNGLSSAKTVTLEYLYDKNIKEIETLIVTHYDSDHSGGVIDLLDNIKVKNLIMPKVECTSKNSCAIKEYIENNKISYIEPYTGQSFETDGVKILNLSPHTNNKKSRNDFSTITLVDIDNYKFLFMADAGVQAFYSVKDYISKVDVLKSAHHGAKGTVEHGMMKMLLPKYSILSTGKNTYGHPNKRTVKILSDYSKVLSTYESGAIKFVIKNNELKPYYFDCKKKKFVEIN